jgi:hypothetical protein
MGLLSSLDNASSRELNSPVLNRPVLNHIVQNSTLNSILKSKEESSKILLYCFKIE